jgi:hypothetical protein
MAFRITNSLAGSQGIATTSTVQNHPLGKIVTASDPTLGEGEFIYLKGVANTTVGLMVYYDVNTGTTALTTTSAVLNRGHPVAVAMSANVASQYGWYQIGGAATILKTAVKVDPALATGMNVHLSATAGRVMQTSVASRQVLGARFASATTVTSTTSTAIVTINRPIQQGRIT